MKEYVKLLSITYKNTSTLIPRFKILPIMADPHVRKRSSTQAASASAPLHLTTRERRSEY